MAAEGLIFSKRKFNAGELEPEYSECQFTNCTFTGLNLSTVEFLESTFSNCQFSDCDLTNTCFKDVEFKECSFMGVDFSKVNPFLLSWRFMYCDLRLTKFNMLSLKGTCFSNCNLSEADFEASDLERCVWKTCDLNQTIFMHSNLKDAVFESCTKLCFNPSENATKGLILKQTPTDGLLLPFGIKLF